MHEPLLQTLASNASKWKTINDWPLESLRLCGQHGLFGILSGFRSHTDERSECTEVDQVELLVGLGKADLLTTFIITQHVGAIKRILGSDCLSSASLASKAGDRHHLKDLVLPALLSGHQFASVGISHLTTSRLHLDRPAVTATRVQSGYRLDGTVPWVTGASTVQHIVVGATLDDRSQILVLLSPLDQGVSPGPGASMIAMSATCTDTVKLEQVFVPDHNVLSGPREKVLADPTRSADAPTGAGGLQTSALALGLSYAALEYLRTESIQRSNLIPIANRFHSELTTLHDSIRNAARGEKGYDAGVIRSNANSLAQRTTSAAMTTAKGAGMMADHPVGRWCQQALFFLVWSCPQPVAQSHLCELVGLELAGLELAGLSE